MWRTTPPRRSISKSGTSSYCGQSIWLISMLWNKTNINKLPLPNTARESGTQLETRMNPIKIKCNQLKLNSIRRFQNTSSIIVHWKPIQNNATNMFSQNTRNATQLHCGSKSSYALYVLTTGEILSYESHRDVMLPRTMLCVCLHYIIPWCTKFYPFPLFSCDFHNNVLGCDICNEWCRC